MVFFIIFPLMFLLDYIFTYIGINSNVITEANPLMVWQFELPFLYGLMVRVLMGAFFVTLLWFGRNTNAFKVGHKIIITANCLVFLLHFAWIIFL